MPTESHVRIPRYGKHATGQAVVRLSGRDHYLGKYGSTAARDKYDRLIQEWLSHGRSLPGLSERFTISRLILAYWRHCEEHYRKADGTPTSELDLVKLALRPVRELYGDTDAGDFGPLALKAVRERMIERKWCRNVINKMVGRVKQMFRWAVENEIVSSSVYHGLQAVTGLRRGRTKARETTPVRPVPEPMIEAVKPHVSKAVSAMIDLQLLTGMRPGEVCPLRACDIDMTNPVWVYRPESHKTEHHGHLREIFFGPQAQAIIKQFLRLDTQAYLFSPWEAREERFQAMRVVRKTKVQPSQANRRKAQPKRLPRDHYDDSSYRRAIAYACERAFPLPENLGPRLGETKKAWLARLTEEERAAVRAWRKQHRWNPHRLRHNAGTKLRRQYGVELARIILGHATAFTTEIYAEADRAQAQDVMAKIG
ncbi:MAG: site-specific integrase [Planctomycetes bacterium]|nr:site-specific integrase [Planctomycetota bacterium]